MSINSNTVQRPSPKILDPGLDVREAGIQLKSTGRQVQQPRADNATVLPDLRNIGKVGLNSSLDFKMLNPSAKDCIMPYSIPLWTILT